MSQSKDLSGNLWRYFFILFRKKILRKKLSSKELNKDKDSASKLVLLSARLLTLKKFQLKKKPEVMEVNKVSKKNKLLKSQHTNFKSNVLRKERRNDDDEAPLYQ